MISSSYLQLQWSISTCNIFNTQIRQIIQCCMYMYMIKSFLHSLTLYIQCPLSEAGHRLLYVIELLLYLLKPHSHLNDPVRHCSILLTTFFNQDSTHGLIQLHEHSLRNSIKLHFHNKHLCYIGLTCRNYSCPCGKTRIPSWGQVR